MKRLVAVFCEPDKAALNWQLHALFLSYLAVRSDELEFLVTVPPGTAHLLDSRIPYRVRDPIHGEYRHPALDAAGMSDGYRHVNHFLAVEALEASYDQILLTDVDTLLLPSFRTLEPRQFLVGRGRYMRRTRFPVWEIAWWHEWSIGRIWAGSRPLPTFHLIAVVSAALLYARRLRRCAGSTPSRRLRSGRRTCW